MEERKERRDEGMKEAIGEDRMYLIFYYSSYFHGLEISHGIVTNTPWRNDIKDLLTRDLEQGDVNQNQRH